MVSFIGHKHTGTVLPDKKPKKKVTHQKAKNSTENLSPSVRRLVKEYDLDVTKITGSGPSGRIGVGDVMKHLGDRALPPEKKGRASELKRNIPSRQTPVSQQIPYATTIFECVMASVLAEQRMMQSTGDGFELPIYYINAYAKTLSAMPEILCDQLPISIGVRLEERPPNSKIPIISGVDKLDMIAIRKILSDLETLEKKTPAFTFCYHGASGSLMGGPATLSEGQIVSLGVGKLHKRAVVGTLEEQDVLQTLPMCYVDLTYNSESIDSHCANRFLSLFVETLEKWPQN
ncbi:MAG: E3 binding domain-containing protein [Pseudomonadota bacterium]|nr:E3 binding domain-containing protein [Pseudomonadota bacterium]